MTQSTHSSVVDYRRRNKYYILPPDFETSKKCINHGRAERWGATAGYGINSHPTPGSLFAMGWSRSLSKDLFTFFKSAKKKNYLLMASILFYFLYHPNRSSPTRSHFIPPALSTGRASFHVPPPSRPRVFGWLLSVIASFIGRLSPRRIFSLIFCRSIRRPNRRHGPIPHAPPRSPLSFIAP